MTESLQKVLKKLRTTSEEIYTPGGMQSLLELQGRIADREKKLQAVEEGGYRALRAPSP